MLRSWGTSSITEHHVVHCIQTKTKVFSPLLSHPLKPGPLPPPRREKGPSKKLPSPSIPGKLLKPLAEGVKPPVLRDVGRPAAPREPTKPTNVRESRRKARQPHDPRRYRASALGCGEIESNSVTQNPLCNLMLRDTVKAF